MASLFVSGETLSDHSSGDDSFDSTDPNPEDEEDYKLLASHFQQAADRLQGMVHVASREQLLYLYARYKQVKVGKCNIPKPGFFDFEGKQKWEAWKALGDASAEQAMKEYVSTVRTLDPSWTPQAGEQKSVERKTAFGGPVVSSLYQEETIREEDKDIFDYCRENNIEHVTHAIRSKDIDVNLKDEEGRTLLHWACDRGHHELVSVLLQHKADINRQDNEGQTALHYASSCEFLDIVDILLKCGADPGLRDQDGALPEEVTDCREICSKLQQCKLVETT
ncbi:hypothetical protein NDU88_003803 [Pleurodeles waltl]|uniref:Acyl-CoA-binding domain-containing protein 6 n=1 Tax=Pleurodeles waltl TaxID=8319 RepID=A0AAV7T6E2_PLEWA|nr:hypothetical protein NDU88_003803 [Pleurodeles waltl]